MDSDGSEFGRSQAPSCLWFGPCGRSFGCAGGFTDLNGRFLAGSNYKRRRALARSCFLRLSTAVNERAWQLHPPQTPLRRLHSPLPGPPSADRMPTERAAHKRPFAAWVKRLTNLHPSSKKAKKASQLKNNPYPQSGRLQHCRHESLTSQSASDNASLNVHHTRDSTTSRTSSLSAPPVNSNRSQANTVATILAKPISAIPHYYSYHHPIHQQSPYQPSASASPPLLTPTALGYSSSPRCQY